MIDIFNHNGTLITSINVEDSSYRYRSIMGDNNITLNFSLSEHIEIPVGAYIDFQAERYTLASPESLTMKHSRHFDYVAVLESAQSNAKKWKFRNTIDSRLKFTLTAKPKEHLQMFVDNMNMRDNGWTVGECINGVEHLISYNHNYCYEALSKMANEFKTEFEIIGKTVSLHKVEYNKNNPLHLSYGMGNGFLPNIKRNNSDNKQPIEILYVQGTERNIDSSKYGFSELHLPKNGELNYDGEKFEGEDGYNALVARCYIADENGLSIKRADKPLSTYAEDSIDLTDIYPSRMGVVKLVKIANADKNFYDIIDTTIPDNLDYSKCLIRDEKMTIIFQSGMLAGREFDVKYFHKEKRFEIVPQEQDGIMMPSKTFIPAIGDKYAIFHCYLPQAYIADNTTKTGAEWDLMRAAIKYLFENEEHKFAFSGDLDGFFAKKDWENIGGKIRLGSYIRFSDERFQKEGILVRITGIKDYINNPHSPKIELSNKTIVGGFNSILQKIETNTVLVDNNKKEAIKYTDRRYKDAQETIAMLETSLLSNYSNSISPIAVKTMSMLVGDESLQFRFMSSLAPPVVDRNFSIMYNPDERKLSAQGSILQHLTLGINSLTSKHKDSDYRSWKIQKYTSAVLDAPNKRYFFYAKCSKIENVGEFILSENAIPMQEVAGYYHFLVGVLNSEMVGNRSFVSLYGFSEILPGRITTDKIVSADGKSYLDLQTGEMQLGDKLKYENGVLSLDYLLSEGANLGGLIFKNNRFEAQNGSFYIDGKNGNARLNGTICLSTSYKGNISDANLFYLPSIEKEHKLSMMCRKEDIGKVVRLYNSSPYKTGARYLIKVCSFTGVVDTNGNSFFGTYNDTYILLSPQSAVELTCFEIPKSFQGREWDFVGEWVVTSRFDLDNMRSSEAIGRFPRMLAMGTLNNKPNYAIVSGEWYDNTSLNNVFKVIREEEGVYKFVLKEGYNLPNKYKIILTPLGRGITCTYKRIGENREFYIYTNLDLGTQRNSDFDFMIFAPNWQLETI